MRQSGKCSPAVNSGCVNFRFGDIINLNFFLWARVRGAVHKNRDELLNQITQAVREVESNAEIILYGSRSRGDAVSESDWDLLILVEGHLNDERIDRFIKELNKKELDYDGTKQGFGAG